MDTTARGTFQVTGWEEAPYQELDGGKLTRANVKGTYRGDIEGEGSVTWLMCYRGDGTARYVGLEHVTGLLKGRAGTFVVESHGDFDGTLANGTWSVIPGSGTDELAGLHGKGRFEAPHGSQASISFDYELD